MTIKLKYNSFFLSFLIVFLKLNFICSKTKSLKSKNKKNSLKTRFESSTSKITEEDTINLTPYDYPKNDLENKETITIAILGTNDIHGQAYEKNLRYGENTLKIGGFKLLSGFINKIRSEFQGKFLWLDAGDQFLGTVENQRTGGSLMIDFFNIMKVDSVAIGNHEWDRKEKTLRKWMKAELGVYADGSHDEWSEEHYGKDNKNLYLSANLKMKEGQKDDLPNKMQVKIFEFEEGNIKIGVIGLTTLETIAKTVGFNKAKYDILDYKELVEEKSEELRAAGCNAVLILSHVGTNCKKLNMKAEEINELYELNIRDINYQARNKCEGEMSDLLEKLFPGTIDGVIAGHIHESTHHFFDDVPVIQNPMSNIFTNILYLNFKKKFNGEYILDKNQIKIEGPIPLCNIVYSNNKRCNEYQDLTDDITLKRFTFHGSSITPDPLVEKLFSSTKYKDLTQQLEEMKKIEVFTTEIRLEKSIKTENVLMNLICDIIKNVTQSDIVFYSPGALRYVWDIGTVSEYELLNMFPFIGFYAQKKMTGKMIIELIKTLQTKGKMGYLYGFSGIKMTLIKEIDGKLTLDEDSLILDDGSKLDPNKEYGVGSQDFFLNGGDDVKYLVDEKKLGDSPITNKHEIQSSIKNGLMKLKFLHREQEKDYLGRIKFVKADKYFLKK